MSYNESLRSNSNYPAMSQSQWDSAPWNQSDVPEKEFTVTISQTLSRTVTVVTNDYIPGAEDVDYEPDDEGGCYASSWHDDDDTSDTDWKKAYEECDFKLQDLIEELKNYVQSDLAMTGPNTGKGRYLKRLLEACDGWIEDEYEVVEE